MNGSIIDVNITLSRWPTRHLREQETGLLVDKLFSNGVTEAWASSLDGLLHKDIASVNFRLATECAAHDKIKLRAFGVINPMLPDWEEDVRRCARDFNMSGVRLFPNYHGYQLNDPPFRKCLTLADKHQLIVSMAVQMEDERMMHPLLRVKPVDLGPLEDTLKDVPNLRFLLLNGGQSLRKNTSILRLSRDREIYMDIALLDGLGAIEEALHDFPLERLLFGSHAPMLYFESALLKLQESQLEHFRLQAIQRDNALRLLGL